MVCSGTPNIPVEGKQMTEGGPVELVAACRWNTGERSLTTWVASR